MRNDPSGMAMATDDMGGSPYQYKAPLELTTTNVSANFGPQSLGIASALIIGVASIHPSALVIGALGLAGGGFAAASTRFGYRVSYLDLQALQSPDYLALERRIYDQTNFSAKSDLEFVTSLTEAINTNLSYDNSQDDQLVRMATGNTAKKNLIEHVVAGKDLVCRDYALYMNYLLGQQGINSEYVEGFGHGYLNTSSH